MIFSCKKKLFIFIFSMFSQIYPSGSFIEKSTRLPVPVRGAAVYVTKWIVLANRKMFMVSQVRWARFKTTHKFCLVVENLFL